MRLDRESKPSTKGLHCGPQGHNTFFTGPGLAWPDLSVQISVRSAGCGAGRWEGHTVPTLGLGDEELRSER